MQMCALAVTSLNVLMMAIEMMITSASFFANTDPNTNTNANANVCIGSGVFERLDDGD